jgi:hypothetical protein
MQFTKKNVGLFLLIAPIPGLIVILTLYAVMSFVLTALVASGAGGGPSMIGQIVNLLLGLLGTLCVAGIIIGMPVGLILLLTAKPAEPTPTPVAPVPEPEPKIENDQD